MATGHDWNAHYAAGELPWDSSEPDPNLVELVHSGVVPKGRVLEIGCGTGTNAVWLAAQGFEVLALDLAPLAVERARAKAGAAERCTFEVRDFLNGELPQGSFQLVFDRGCFHVFDDAKEQLTFAARVGKVLASGGHWLSLLGSTEGPAREMGPPRRMAREVLQAIEPALELVQLRAIEFDGLPGVTAPKAWFCLSRRRDLPAQPSSRFS